MNMNMQTFRPNLRWYHYLFILFVALPFGSGETAASPYELAGLLTAGFVFVWGLTATWRYIGGKIANWRKDNHG